MGYFPIAAHIERYECMVNHPELVEELHNMRMSIQINAASVTGEAGRKCKVFVHKLLRRQIVDYVGAVIGAVISVGVIAIRFLMDDTIKSSEDIEKYLELSTLALVPDRDTQGMKKVRNIKGGKES